METVATAIDIAKTVQDLADQHQIEYVPSPTDELAFHISRLCSDDPGTLDDTELLLIALRRAGHLNGPEFIRLQSAYLRQKRH